MHDPVTGQTILPNAQARRELKGLLDSTSKTIRFLCTQRTAINQTARSQLLRVEDVDDVRAELLTLNASMGCALGMIDRIAEELKRIGDVLG